MKKEKSTTAKASAYAGASADKSADKEEEKKDENSPAVEEEIKKEENPPVGGEENWQKKADEYLNGWKRCQADFENYKKRHSEERKELIVYGNMRLILEILPVIDNFHTSTDHVPEDQKDNAWVTGIMHIQKQLEQVLTDNGVSEIPAKVGDAFDPEIHEAIEDKDDKKEEFKNIIRKIVQKGYKIGDRVIRAVRVIVE